MADKPAAGKTGAKGDSVSDGSSPAGPTPATSARPAPTPAQAPMPPQSSIRLDLLMLVGFAMIAGGFLLAAAQRGDPAFAWTGAALLVLGGLGDRIQKVVAGKDSFEVDLASRVETVNSMVKATPAATRPAATSPAASSGPKAGRRASGPVKGLLMPENEDLAALLGETGPATPDPASIALAVTAAVGARTPAEYGQRMAELSKLLSGR